jgi:hypothetical protein
LIDLLLLRKAFETISIVSLRRMQLCSEVACTAFGVWGFPCSDNTSLKSPYRENPARILVGCWLRYEFGNVTERIHGVLITGNILSMWWYGMEKRETSYVQ